MAKLPGSRGSGRRHRARDAHPSPGHVMVVRVGSSALAVTELRLCGGRTLVRLQSGTKPTAPG